MTGGSVAAVDLGATSGRVMIGKVGPGELSLVSVARFPNGPVASPEGWRWDFTRLFERVVDGLADAAQAQPELASVGIDSWAVDYGLVRAGALLSEPFHYRDERTTRGVSSVHLSVPPAELYHRNGLQHLPFNTLYQYVVDGALADAEASLLIPDLMAYLLTGVVAAERTNASTTGLLDVRTGTWDRGLALRLGIPFSALPPLVDAGSTIGMLSTGMAARVGKHLPVIAVGSHDTASAVVAAPLKSSTSAFISCGTWGLVGVELDAPVVTDAAREANFTNEAGVDGRIRFLHNVTGLWLLSETIRAWEAEDSARIDLPRLLAAAAKVDPPKALIAANDQSLNAPGDMPIRIAALLRQAGDPVPDTRPAFARLIIESIAAALASTVHAAGVLADVRIETINVVGGGALNELLCQATADRAGIPVLAGPVEATALGNVLIQARAHGWFGPDASLETLRESVTTSFTPRRYDPRR